MKKVKFVRVKAKVSGYGIHGLKYEFDGIRDIIKEKTTKGWSYKGFVPIEQRGGGEISVMDLIFEIDDDEN